MRLTGKRQARSRQGYSLVELLLTVALLLSFSGLALLSMRAMSQGASLTEGTIRFETLLRFARAEAAYSGRRVRVEFLEETREGLALPVNDAPLRFVQLSWEPNPMSEPGVFHQLQANRWGLEQVNETVGVKMVRLTDSAAATSKQDPEDATATHEFDEPVSEPTFLTFSPEGLCDSAEITLASRSPEDSRHMIVRLEGFTGSVSHREPGIEDEQEGDYPSNGTDTPGMADPGDFAAQ